MSQCKTLDAFAEKRGFLGGLRESLNMLETIASEVQTGGPHRSETETDEVGRPQTSQGEGQ